jgi:hypothetical protein
MPWRSKDYRAGWSGKDYRKHLEKRKKKREQVRRYRAKKKALGFRYTFVKVPPQYQPTYSKMSMNQPRRKKLPKFEWRAHK